MTLVLAAVLSFNPVVDLLRGPLVVEARVESVRRWETRRQRGYEVVLVGPAGRRIEIEPVGLHSDHWVHMLRRCQAAGAPVRVAALRQLDEFLDVRCDSE